MWRVQNPNSTFQDMAKLEFVKSGAGDCGSWPDMLLVGWSDGLFQALRADNGAIVWQHQTEATLGELPAICWLRMNQLPYQREKVR